ncbi:MAG: PstS family phosphate ABC transporter substrate-binding protein [Desulfobacterales bacterium]|nr:PstS family phosphate ABC transporter substrate-binding protein [Desulfobacterales bacterium]
MNIMLFVKALKFNQLRFNSFLINVLAVSILFCISTSNLFANTPKTILRIHGSNTIGAKLMPALAVRYMEMNGYQLVNKEKGAGENEFFIVGAKDNDVHRIEIKAHGSSTGFKSLKSKACDIGMASRRIKKKEVDGLKALGDMTSIKNEHILAIDGIAIIVNKANKIKEADKILLQKLFSGKLKNWKQAGGKDALVKVYARDNQSGTYDTFKSMILKKISLHAKAKRYESNADLSRAVSKDPNGIGFVGMPYVLNSKALLVKRTPDTPGIEGNFLTLACEDYPLARRLYLYSAEKKANKYVNEFIDFCLGEEGQNIVSLLGFAKLAMDMDAFFEANTSRFKEPSHNNRYKSEIFGGHKVNFNFKFTESGDLEVRSQKDLERLIKYVRQPDQRFYELVLIGVNACSQARDLKDTIVQQIGINQFYVPPKAICLDYVSTRSGKSIKPVVEVWMRAVDDGA